MRYIIAHMNSEQTLLPAPREDEPSNVLHLSQFTNPANLSQHAQDLTRFVAGQRRPKEQTLAERKLSITRQFEEVFHLIGGVPRLALWADQNPTQFFALYSKLIPASIKAELPGGLDKEALEHISTVELKALAIEAMRTQDQSAA